MSSFLTVALVLGAVFAVLSLRVREQVRQSVADNLASAQQVFTRVEARRQQDVRATVATLAENPDAQGGARYLADRAGTANERTSDELLATVQREADKMAERVAADVLAVTDADGRIVASGGRLAASWPRGVDHRGRTDADGRDRSLGDRRQRRVSRDLACRCSWARRRSDRSSSAPRSTALRARARGPVARPCGDLSKGPSVLASTLSRSGGARSGRLPR